MARTGGAGGIDLRQYAVVTASYWAFTITDGALRMLVVLYFHNLGYSPLAIASLFLFYEFFGVVTNLYGGWLATRIGLNMTMHLGMALQILALAMLLAPQGWLSVAYVMVAQALSGIAKDLNKMSAKSSIKLLLPADAQGALYRWVAVLTGSKNALKGAGFFVGALLLTLLGFRGAVLAMATGLLLALAASYLLLNRDLGKAATPKKFSRIFAKSGPINRLSAARFFLFGARDVWFVVALPVYLQAVLGWDHWRVGTFLALWVIGYGAVQAAAPLISPMGRGSLIAALRGWKLLLAALPALIATSLWADFHPGFSLVTGLLAFGAVFAMTSAIHSYLIVGYARTDDVSLDVGFYYMCNAGGRLAGTVLSGLVYQFHGLAACLLLSALLVLASAAPAWTLPEANGGESVNKD